VHGFHGNLNDRNQAAHPTAFDPGVNETLGYIEGLLKMAAKIGQRPCQTSVFRASVTPPRDTPLLRHYE
jgi:hypothetical protein